MAVEVGDLTADLDGYRFGDGTNLLITDIDYGIVDIISNDAQLPRADGIRFGRDYRAGRTITFELSSLLDPGAGALGQWAQLESTWLAGRIRSQPGAVSTLRLGRAGRTRVVYGRPRRFAPIGGKSTFGNVDATADFQCVDHLFYGAAAWSDTLSIVPPPAGGLTFPIEFPWGTVAESSEQGHIVVGGTSPAWMVFLIRGPIAQPTIEVVDEWSLPLNLTLLAGEYVVIDPRPWSRGVRKNGLINVAGALSPAAPRLSDVRLDPGVHEVVLRGTDQSGTASLTAEWRDAYNSP